MKHGLVYTHYNEIVFIETDELEECMESQKTYRVQACINRLDQGIDIAISNLEVSEEAAQVAGKGKPSIGVIVFPCRTGYEVFLS